MTDRVRLHITPFNPDLLDRYISASLKPLATNTSLHSVETFPEKGFGFVELPTAEAQRLKNKFNGMTLKGSKVRIEEARKEKKRKVEDADEEVEVKKPSKKAKKAKPMDGVLEGYELPEGRVVKRGWTDEAGKKGKDGKVKKEEKKMKFKTMVPPNAVPADGAGEKTEKKEKKVKTAEEKAAKAERRAMKKEALVKEFAHTTKLNFPNSAGDKKHKHYEEGVGWVDEEGNVLEPEPPSKRRKREKKEKKEKKVKKAAEKIPTPSPEPEMEAAVEPESEVDGDMEVDEAPALSAKTADASEDEQAASSAASESESDNDSLDDHLNQAESNTVSNGATIQPRDATPTAVGEVVDEVDELDAEVAKEVHPLEALYKRADSKPAPIDTSFNFFAAGGDDDDDTAAEETGFVPQTPHTKEDLEWRSVRSAAPTPDTAAIGKKFNFPPTAAIAQEDDGEDEDEDDEVEKELGDGKGEESEFRKWFYANRGDLNRGWKKRRKEERKVVRQRENRRASRKIA